MPYKSKQQTTQPHSPHPLMEDPISNVDSARAAYLHELCSLDRKYPLGGFPTGYVLVVGPPTFLFTVVLLVFYYRARAKFPISAQFPLGTMAMCAISAISMVYSWVANIHYHGVALGVLDTPCGLDHVSTGTLINVTMTYKNGTSFVQEHAISAPTVADVIRMKCTIEILWEVLTAGPMVFLAVNRCLAVFNKHYRAKMTALKGVHLISSNNALAQSQLSLLNFGHESGMEKYEFSFLAGLNMIRMGH